MAFRPERAFRIADARHPIFDGTGAFLAGARWNSAGKRVIYAADSFAAAMLEVLAHTGIGRIPSSHKWIEISIPANVSLEVIDPTSLNAWDEKESQVARQFGDNWFDARRSLVLVVPSLVTNGLSSNILINQQHPEFAQISASEPREVAWDARLFASPKSP